MRKFITFSLLLCAAISLQAKKYEVKSPDGRLSFTVECGARSSWALAVDGKTLSEGNRLGMEIQEAKGRKVLGDKAVVQKCVKREVRREIETPLYRQKSVRDDYNELILKCKGGYQIELRAYDEGVAYRFATSRKDSLTILNEFVEFHTGGAMDAFIP